MALVLDTGVLYAALDPNQADHEACRRLIEESLEEVVIPAPILVEVDYFIGRHLYQGVFNALLLDIQLGNFRVVDLRPEDYERIADILSRYSTRDIGFVDAAVLATVERLNESKLATLDREDFSIIRPRHVDHLTLLP